MYKLKPIGKKGATNSTNWWLGIAVVVLIFIAYSQGAFDSILGTTASTTGGTTTGGTTTGGTIATVCPVPGNTLTVGPMQARNLPGTSVSAQNGRVYVNGVDQGTKADASTMTINAGSTVEIIYGIDSTLYYSDYVKFAMPCGPVSSSEISESVSAYYDSTYDKAHKIWTAETQPTLLAFSGDTGNLNNGTGADNETIGAADTGRFTLTFTSDADQAISPPRHGLGASSKLLIIVEQNGTLYDTSKTLLSGAVKSSYRPSSTVLTLDNAVDELVVFEVTGCPTGDARACSLSLGTLSVETKSGAGNDPGVLNTGLRDAASVGRGAIKITLAYDDFYRHTIQNSIQFGPQQDDGAYAGNPSIDQFWLSVA